MSEAKTTLTKFALLAQILEAATLLHSLGLVKEAPNTFVKKYVEANPDINEAMKKLV